MQRILIVLVLGLLAVGCATMKDICVQLGISKPNTPEQKQKTLRDSVVGTYERNDDGDGSTVKAVFLDNGIVEGYRDGEKDDEGKWKIINKEIHIVLEDEDETHILIINPDSSVTIIARIREDGKRVDGPTVEKFTFKKIK